MGVSCCNSGECRPVRTRSYTMLDGAQVWQWWFAEARRWEFVDKSVERDRVEGDPDHAHICTTPPYQDKDGKWVSPHQWCFTAGQMDR
jgi:hypothetical protein